MQPRISLRVPTTLVRYWLLIAFLFSLGMVLPTIAPTTGGVYAQGSYKQQYIYAHTFEASVNAGIYRFPTDINCVKMTNVTPPGKSVTTTSPRRPSGGCDPPGDDIPESSVTVSLGESQGGSQVDDSFDGGVNTRCFSMTNVNEVPTDLPGTPNRNDNFSLTFDFARSSAPVIKGIYFEIGQVNMSGVFQADSKAQYRLLVFDGYTELFRSGVLENYTFWNKFYVPFTNINTKNWESRSLRFEIRAWNNGFGTPFFRYDDIALIGYTACNPPNGRIGNLVWEDTNNNGIADSGEPPIAGVTVDLYGDDGNGIFEASKDKKITTTTTDASGNYLFDGLGIGSYYVGIGYDNFRGIKALRGYVPTSGAAVSGNSDTDNRDHAIERTGYKFNGVRSDVITLTTGGEPTSDGDDANGNLTIDFGFFRLANPLNLGNLVWEDTDLDGIKDVGESGLDRVVVQLYRDTDASGGYSIGDVFVDSITTTGGGFYRFDDLSPGDYVGVINTANFGEEGALKGYVPSPGLDPASDPDDNTDNDDNGVLTGYRVSGKAITLAVGTEPTSDGDGANGNMTYDFGFAFNCTTPGAKKSDVAFGGADGETLGKVIKTPDGNVLLAGTSSSGISGDKSQANSAKSDYWVVKSSPSGGKIWDFRFGGTSTDQLVSAQNTTDGGYLLAGISQSPVSGNKTVAIQSITDVTFCPVPWVPAPGGCALCVQKDVWIVKIDGNGVKQWDKLVHFTATDSWTINWMEPTSDGGFLLGNTNTGGIVKIDANGDKVWTQTYNGKITPITGGGFIYLNNTNMDVKKLDAAGAVLWTKSYANTITSAKVAKQTTDGGFITSGVNGTSSLIRKLDYAGNQIWFQTITNLSITDIEETSDGSFIVSGTTGSGATSQYRVLKMSSTGTTTWDQNYGGTDSETLACNILSFSGSYLLAGTSNSATGGGKSAASKGSTDYWMLSICDGSGPIGGTLKLGNLVWNDANNNGMRDAGEGPIADVKIDLFVDEGNGYFSSTNDVLIGSTTTDGSGNYSFEGLPADNYFIRINKANFKANKPLYRLLNSTGRTDSNTDLNDKDHGTDTQMAGSFGIISSMLTLSLNGEPINDGDTDNNSNLSIDFGFYKPPPVLCLGNLVYFDTNNNYKRDAGEPPIQGVTVQLWADADGDDMLNTSKDTHIGVDQVTDASGLYKFCSLEDGNYFVNIPSSNWAAGQPLNGLVSTNSFTGGDFVIDNYDHGMEEPTYDEANLGVASTSITLVTGTEPDVAIDGDDKNGNMTIDFGFYRPVNIGDLVWSDTNRDGVKDAAELPIGGVQVDLFIDNGDGLFDPLTDMFYWQQNTFTDGTYVFDRLTEGKYFSRISPTNFNLTTGILKDLKQSKGSVTGNSNLNNKDHGVDALAPELTGVTSTVVDLNVTVEPPIGVDGDGTDGNLTIDFGFGPKCTATISATPSACAPATGTYSLSGSITVTNPPTVGTVIISDGGVNTTISAPFSSPINYTLTGLLANGASRAVTFVFSECTGCANSATYTSPVDCRASANCSLAITATAAACDPITGNYTVSGNVTFSNAPSTGTMTVSNGTVTQTFSAPFVSPQAYTLSGLQSDGGTHSVVASFSANVDCVNGVSYLSPADCLPTVCVINLSSAAGAKKAGDVFDVTGSLSFDNAPTTGTLTVAGGGKTQVYNPPFSSPQAFTLTDVSTPTHPLIVTATFSAGCNASTSLVASALKAACSITATATKVNALCNAGNTGTATAIPAGAAGAVTYLWSNGQTTATATALIAGTYTVTVSESPTCTATATATVGEPTAVMYVVNTSADATCYGNLDGSLSFTASGGTAPYMYSIDNGISYPNATGIFSGLRAAQYKLAAKDANGCVVKCP
jgi:SdrD B-like domain/SprB repeat